LGDAYRSDYLPADNCLIVFSIFDKTTETALLFTFSFPNPAGTPTKQTAPMQCSAELLSGFGRAYL
jgi:hypothetical protein